VSLGCRVVGRKTPAADAEIVVPFPCPGGRKETMSELTIDRQATRDTCQHCRSVYEVSHGSVYDDGAPFALYIAGMHGCESDPVVALVIAIARPEGETPSAITLQVRPSKTQFEMRIIAPYGSPWRSHAYLGHMLTRDEMLSSPLREMFFQIADIVVTDNP
jgi:hypothetical protein